MMDQKMKTKWILAIGKHRLPKEVTLAKFIFPKTTYIVFKFRCLVHPFRLFQT